MNYWLAQNSWGPSWGCIGGYFMITDVTANNGGFNTNFIVGPYAKSSLDKADASTFF